MGQSIGGRGNLAVTSASSGGGANPAGSGSELQARATGTTFQAVTGSSVDISGNLTLTSSLTCNGNSFAINAGDQNIVSMGTNGAMTFVNGSGLYSFSGIPTADPHTAGQLYTVAGVLHVSAG